MTAPKPDHLFEQAERLIASPPHGPSRQVDLRRAISSAYYGVFHFIMAAAANEFVGASNQRESRYGLVYRSIDHAALRALCIDAVKSSPPTKYLEHLPKGGFGASLKGFAVTARELQQKRHRADYDPMPRFKIADARIAVRAARGALVFFQAAPESERKTFLTLLVCPPRRGLSPSKCLDLKLRPADPYSHLHIAHVVHQARKLDAYLSERPISTAVK